MNNTVLYDKHTGRILYQKFTSDRESVTDLAVLEIPEGKINYDTHYIESIDENGEPVVKPRELTPVELENAKLKEDILLLKTDSDTGGIL